MTEFENDYKFSRLRNKIKLQEKKKKTMRVCANQRDVLKWKHKWKHKVDAKEA